MAQQALGPGTAVPRQRALFGLLDANGWGWASIKAFVWLVIIILMLGYLPDRAYYLTVGRTVELGVLIWSPINLCPPTNEGLPCPAPVGALIPWEPSPPELSLPQGRTEGSVLQVGTQILYIGGSDGKTASASVYVAKTVGTGNFDKWADGPPLPAPRANASVDLRRREHLRHGRHRRLRSPDRHRLRPEPEQPDRAARLVVHLGRPEAAGPPDAGLGSPDA